MDPVCSRSKWPAAVGEGDRVVGTDLSGKMVARARQRAAEHPGSLATFERTDAQQLLFPDASFDVVTCALGLMYIPDPEQALRETRRVLRVSGRLALAVWGERSRCAWSEVFPFVDAEVSSDVCPMFSARSGGGCLRARARKQALQTSGRSASLPRCDTPVCAGGVRRGVLGRPGCPRLV